MRRDETAERGEKTRIEVTEKRRKQLNQVKHRIGVRVGCLGLRGGGRGGERRGEERRGERERERKIGTERDIEREREREGNRTQIK